MQGKQLKRLNIYQYTYYAQKWHCRVCSEEKFPLFALLQAELDEARFCKLAGALRSHNGRYISKECTSAQSFWVFFLVDLLSSNLLNLIRPYSTSLCIEHMQHDSTMIQDKFSWKQKQQHTSHQG